MALTIYENRGQEIREFCKALVLDFMRSTGECQTHGIRMKQSQIFKRCGFEWGEYLKASASNQQYWIVAILSELEKEGKVERVSESGPWRLL